MLPPKGEAAQETTTSTEDIGINNNKDNNKNNNSQIKPEQFPTNDQQIEKVKRQKLRDDNIRISETRNAESEYMTLTQAPAEEEMKNLGRLLYLNSILERQIHTKFQELDLLDKLCQQKKSRLGLLSS